MFRIYLFPLYLMFIFASMTAYSHAGSAISLGNEPGCSALSKPDVDCTDFASIRNYTNKDFIGTMGFKGIQIRPNMSNDTDTDGESDGIEACICDALDNNPNLNINPGDGSICDSSIPEERDQFVGYLFVLGKVHGQNYRFRYEFTDFPDDICAHED